MTRNSITGGTPGADGPRLQSSPAPSVNDVPRRPSGRVVASKESSRTLSEAQLQRLATLVANEVRGAMAVALMALGEAGEKLAAMQMPETNPEQEGSMLPIERAAAVLASAPKPISSGELAEAIGIKRASWAKYATRALKDGRFERRYPQGWKSNPLWWRRGGDGEVWRIALAEWKSRQRRVMALRPADKRGGTVAERRANMINRAATILKAAREPLTTDQLTERLGISGPAWCHYTPYAVDDPRIERRYPAGVNSYSRWWRSGGDEDVWSAALAEAKAERRAARSGAPKGRGDGWPTLMSAGERAALHRRWEREKPFAVDTLTFKRGPVMDFTRRMPSTQSFSGTAAALAAEAA